MPMIIPISELRNTNEICELAHSRNEPIFITKNGYGSLVLMSMEAYQLREELMDLKERLLEAHAGYLDGEKCSMEEVSESILSIMSEFVDKKAAAGSHQKPGGIYERKV